MPEVATISRYCAIEGRLCEKEIPFQGLWTFFFAYPGAPHWQDFAGKLQEESQERGVNISRWEDFVKNDLLFDKVCDGIHGHDYLLAEVTEPNPNVLLEIGYAMAVGRRPILLQNKNRTSWSRDLLTTLESCMYETRDDIHSYLARFIDGPRSDEEDPNRQLKYLENMGILDLEESPNSVYHLKPKRSADWISRVDRVLRRSFFRTITMDPSDSVYDEFYPQAREIQRASLIVASLLSSKDHDWEQLNAQVSLLIGFSVGLGKQVLVLQEEPLRQILDLGSVSRPFRTETDAERITEAWIAAQTSSQSIQTAERRKAAATRQQANRIRKVYLGHPDALQDNRLLEYYVQTKEFEDAIEGKRSIFIGRRGSGKSATFRAVNDELRQRPDTLLATIAPDDYEFERLSDYLGQLNSTIDHRLTFQSTWNYILVTEILKSVAERTDKLLISPGTPTTSSLWQYYSENRGLLDLDFGTRAITALEQIAPPPGASVSPALKEQIEHGVKSLREYQVERHLKSFAEAEDIRFFVVADDLDKHWRLGTQQAADFLIGLVAEADKMQRFFEGRLHVVMFLREDIFDVLVEHDEDLPKRNFLRMEWTPNNLKHLVAERLAVLGEMDNKDDDVTWNVIYPEKVKGVPSIEYVLSRALPRPRDVLDFCQRAIDQAQRNGHTSVTEQDLLDGEASFSYGLFSSVVAEFRGLYPGLDEVLIEFAGVSERLEWKEFHNEASKALAKCSHLVEKWGNTSNVDPHFMAQIFFNVGVIGLSDAKGRAPHFRNGRSFAETWNLVSQSPVVHIHPGFAKWLDVSSVAVLSPARRRRRGTGELQQLPLEGLEA